MTVWQVHANVDKLWRAWGAHYVVFSPLSGETHVLDIVSGSVFERLTRGPAKSSDIHSEIADFLDVDMDPELTNAVDGILQSLEHIGLVESAS